MRFELFVTLSKDRVALLLSFVGDLSLKVKSWLKFWDMWKIRYKMLIDDTGSPAYTTCVHICGLRI